MIRDPHHELAGRPGRLRGAFHMNLEPLPQSGFGDGMDPEFCAFKRQFFADFQVKMTDRFWTSLDVDHPRFADVVDALEALARDGVAKPVRGSLSTWLEDQVDRPLEWFLVEPRMRIDLESWDPPRIKACNVMPGGHLARSSVGVCVSGRFRSWVEDSVLTGLELLWVQDVGRYRARQWYRALAREPLGRGIDHPWFDWPAYEEGYRTFTGDRAADPSGKPRHAIRQFNAGVFDARARAGNEWVDRLVRLFSHESALDTLTFVSFPRVVRSALPTTDFAFLTSDPIPPAFDDPSDAGMLCVKRRARDLLLEAGLIGEDELRGILVMEDDAEGVQALDREAWPIPRWTDGKKFDSLRRSAELAWERYQEKELPEREPDLERSLRRVREARTRRPDLVGKRVTAKKVAEAVAELRDALPGAWTALLETANGFVWHDEESQEVAAESVGQLVALHEALSHAVLELELEPPGNWLHVGHFGDGDMLALDLDTLHSGGDCEVLRVSHETHGVDRRWSSVAAFLDEVFAEV